MKKIGFLAAGLLISFSADANLSRSSITEMNAQLYGLYTSPDPTCSSGFVATLPLQTSPRVVNLVSKPRFGTGRISKSVACVAMIMKNSVVVSWDGGSYGGTDSVCNAGGSATQIICKNQGGGDIPVDWPAQITSDMSAAGLTRTTLCTAGAAGSEIVAVFLSTNAACTGNSILDAAVAGCGNANSFQAPTAVGDTTKGVKLSVVSGRRKYRVVIDPDLSVGNQGGVCANVSPPTFSLK